MAWNNVRSEAGDILAVTLPCIADGEARGARSLNHFPIVRHIGHVLLNPSNCKIEWDSSRSR